MPFSSIFEWISQLLEALAGFIPALKPFFGYIDGKPVLEILALVVLAAAAGLIVNYLYFFIMKAAGILVFTVKSKWGKKKEAAPVRSLKGPSDPLAVIIKAIQYLTKKKEWRYATPWYLMAGDENSRKPQLLSALDSGRRQRLLLKEKSLVVKDTGWNFYNNGIVIDIDSDIFDPEKQGENKWENILAGISYNRPERAVDGVILTVSAKELLENENRMEKKGYLFYKRFLKIQDVFALSLPVYLIVTGCEDIEGFKAFWETQKQGHLDALFGWSNPYTADTAFLPEWIDTAIERIFNRLQDAQINSVSGKKPILDPDRFFLFPYHFSKMKPSLKKLTSAIFRPASYHSSFLFRGIYFTGAKEWGEPERLGDTDPPAYCFVKTLFEQKIFAEKNLALPIRKRIISRNKIIRNFQFAMIGIALALVAVFITDEIKLIRQIRNIKGISMELQNAATDCTDSGSQVLAVLKKLTQIDGSPFYISFITSWYDKLPHQISRYIADKCLESVYASLECRIRAKAEQINHALSGSPGADTGAFINLLTEIREFEENLNRFMVLCGDDRSYGNKQTLNAFKSLLAYLYTDNVPAALMKPHGIYVETLKDIRYKPSWQSFDITGKYVPDKDRERLSMPIPTPLEVKERVLAVSGEVRSALLKKLEIPYGISPLTDKTGRSAVKPLVAAEKMGRWLDDVITLWGTGADDSSPCGQLETAVGTLQKTLEKTGYEHGSFDTAHQSFGTTCVPEAGKILSGQLIAPDGQLFSMTRESGLEIKPAAMVNDMALDELVQTGFMQYEIGTAAYRPGVPAAWDTSKLELAVKYYREYESFLKKGFGPDAPPGNQAPKDSFYKRLAKKQVEQVLKQLVYEAQIGRGQIVHMGPVFQPVSSEEAFLNADIGNLTQSEELIKELLSIAGLNAFDYIKTDLLNAATQYSLNLLDACNKLLTAANPYRPVPDPQWTGETFTAILFNITGTEQLKNYLEAQQKRIRYISSNYARPIVMFLLSIRDPASMGSYNLYKKWFQTLTEIDKYEKHDPGSRIPLLENFFTNTLAKKTIHTYDPLKADTLFGTDIFTRSYNRISRIIGTQSSQYDRTGIDRSYNALVSQFNTYLKGRYPFVGDAAGQTGDADPDGISQFIRTCKDEMAGLEKKFSGESKPSYSARATEFVRQMQAAVAFLSPLLGSPPGSFVVEPEFRKFSSPSDGTNQIIEWRLSSGSSSVTYPRAAESKTVSWTYGDKVALDLRWASGSTVKPVSTAGHRLPEIRDKTAAFTYDGPWALLKFLSEHRDMRLQSEKKTDVLTAFEIPVVKTADTGDAPMETVKLYVKVQLAVKNPKTGLPEKIEFPKFFPGYAPALKQAGDTE